MSTPVFQEFAHFSPPATELDAPTAEVEEIAHEVADYLLQQYYKHAFAHVTIPSRKQEYERSEITDLRNAVTTALPDLGTNYGIRLRVVGNAVRAKKERKLKPGLPNYNLHTDFDVVNTLGDIKIEPKKHGRIAIIFNGDGTKTLNGTFSAQSSQRFEPQPASRATPEQQMTALSPLLTGSAGQFIRGPIDRINGLDTSQAEWRTLPAGRWHQLDPATAHELPEELHSGRIVINVDK